MTNRFSAFIRRLPALARMLLRRFDEEQVLPAASNLTLTTLLALVPIVTVSLTLLASLPAFAAMTGVLEDWVFDNLLPESADALESYADEFIHNAGKLTAVGIAFLGVTSVMLLLTIDDAFNRIWRVRRQRTLGKRIFIYGALLVLGPVMIGGSLWLTSWLVSAAAGWTQHAPHDNALLIKASALGLTAGALAFLYFLMPNRPVRVRDALLGGVLAGIALEFTKFGLGAYVSYFPTYEAMYGAFSAFPIFLLWLYVSWTVVLAGALVVAALPEWRRRSVQGLLAPGSHFLYALEVLRQLAEVREGGGAVTVPQLHAALNLRYERIERLLETLERAGWVQRAKPAAWQRRAEAEAWSFAQDPAHITLEDVYRRFVFDPQTLTTEAQPMLGELAKLLATPLGANGQRSLAALFADTRSQTALGDVKKIV